MKSLLLLLLLVFGVNAGPSWTQCFSGISLSGYNVYFENDDPDLYIRGIDNDIESVYQTGMWVYYEDYNYNSLSAAKVYFVHGIDIAVNFPTDYQNIMSSLRFVGSLSSLNADTITLYEGTAFTGNSYYSEYDASSLGSLAGHVSSLAITGLSPWTVYIGEGFTGSYWCVYNTDHDVGTNGQTLDLGIYPSVEYAGIPDNSIRSVRKGCWANRVAKAPELKVESRQKNGAWGRLL